jgi:hypothetical protein
MLSVGACEVPSARGRHRGINHIRPRLNRLHKRIEARPEV